MVLMVGDALSAGFGHAVDAGFAEFGSAAFVFVVGGDVADRGVEPDLVVLAAHDVEFGA